MHKLSDDMHGGGKELRQIKVMLLGSEVIDGAV